MKKILLNIALAGALTVSFAAYAQDNYSNSTTATQQEMMQTWKNMPQKQKDQVREQLKEDWAKLTPDQKAEVRKSAEKKWDKLNPYEKQKVIETYLASQPNNSTH